MIFDGCIIHKLASISSMSSTSFFATFLLVWAGPTFTFTFFPASIFFLLSDLTSLRSSLNISYHIFIHTSTSSSSDSPPTISLSLSSISFCLILAYSPSKMMSCSFSEYFYCSFRWSETVSKASMVSMSMMACSSWNFLSTSTFFLRV